MNDNAKVFSSNITRSQHSQKNNLYDLIHVEPAQPLVTYESQKNTSECHFTPRTDKCYIPKKKYNRSKVKTVTDIRKEFEQDTYSYLNTDLERQENILLKKIRSGLSGEATTKTLAQNVLKAETPISRSSLQMLLNINPYNHINPKQYVLYNGKHIQINGSLGGKNRFICNYDLAFERKFKKRCFRKEYTKKTKGLLKNSLDVKFKPGPLGLKQLLDNSHQKYHVGDIALVDLPKPGLDIQPSYGTALDPSIAHLLNNLRKDDGTIAPKWAEFAVSVLGTIKNSNPVLVSNDNVTFNFNYKYDQSRILMRRDLDSKLKEFPPCNQGNHFDVNDNLSGVLPEVTDIMNKIIDSVEISLIQNDIYNIDEDFIESVNESSNMSEKNMGTSIPNKKKYGGELGRLDVTVINIPDVTEDNMHYVCKKSFCALGCICQSLAITHNLKYHCGRVECMFQCSCNFAKYKSMNTLDSSDTDLMPALENIDRAINVNLAKEEKKFHQTVIVSGHKRILLKSEKRNWKTSKKYADFYSNMRLKNQNKNMLHLAIMSPKLNCKDIEIWCMVHNLYRCFCKGKFTDTRMSNLKEITNKELAHNNIISDVKPVCGDRKNPTVSTSNESYAGEAMDTTKDGQAKAVQGSRETRSAGRLKNVSANLKDPLRKISLSSDDDENSSCSRVTEYVGRKYSKNYYRYTNAKIFEMEKNDKTLQRRLMTTLKCIEEVPKLREKSLLLPNANYLTSNSETCLPNSSTTKDDLYKDLSIPTIQLDSSETPDHNKTMLPRETKLVAWLVANYHRYKDKVDKGKTVLLPPASGKVAMHSWDFILQRYREHKNVFMISKQKPFRIYMAVHAQDPFFHNCININEIRFIELHKYPQTVRDLLTNSTGLKDNFCVLRGLPQCWEIVGMIAKVARESKEESLITETLSTESTSNTVATNDQPETNAITDNNISLKNDQPVAETTDKNDQPVAEPTDIKRLDSIETSKWFVMTVENDFTEIRFYRKGFFVTYEKIIKAINVARLTGKTVRLSSSKCTDKNSSPQFGIYAISCKNEHCVFVGPYEAYDSLGIESIKNVYNVHLTCRRTRGFWLKTDKIDNNNVISNPMSFMTKDQNNKVDLLDNLIKVTDSCQNDDVSFKIEEPAQNTETSAEKQTMETNIKPDRNVNFKIPTLPNENISAKLNSLCVNKDIESKPVKANDDATSKIKILDVYSMRDEESLVLNQNKSKIEDDTENTTKVEIQTRKKGFEMGMFVLKPEEINRKALKLDVGSSSSCESSTIISDNNCTKDLLSNCLETFNTDVSDSDLDLAYEKCLEESNAPGDPTSNDNDMTSQPRYDSTEECYILSSDDDRPFDEIDSLKIIWLQSAIGWVKGAMDQREYISYKLRDCDDSKFYPKSELWTKLNTDLFQKAFDTTGLLKSGIKWSIVSSARELIGQEIRWENTSLLKKLLIEHGTVKITTVPANSNLKKLLIHPSNQKSAEEVQKLIKTYCNSGSGSTSTVTSLSLNTLQTTEEENDIPILKNSVNTSIPSQSTKRQDSQDGGYTTLNINSLLQSESSVLNLRKLLDDQKQLMNMPFGDESDKTAEEKK